MFLKAAAIQMRSTLGDVPGNLERAEQHLERARESGAMLAVLPEMFNTGYGLIPDYSPLAEERMGPSLTRLAALSRRFEMIITAGFVERDGPDLFDALALLTPEGGLHVYRKRHLVFWENYRFRPGRESLVVETRFGRIGLAICADMIYTRIWDHYRDRIDLAVVSAAWPNFSNRETGRSHWLFGHVGPLSAKIPERVASDLGVPVIFSNQCGDTRTAIPLIRCEIADRFAGSSRLVDGRHGLVAAADSDESVIVGGLTVHRMKGLATCRFMSRSASEAL